MTRKAYLIGGGIGNLAAAAFMIRDGNIAGEDICILDAAPFLGGSLDGSGNPERGYSLRGGRMFTFDNYECTWELFKSIPSTNCADKTVFEETVDFNEDHVSHAQARLVNAQRAKVPVSSMGFSMHDRLELLKLAGAGEEELADSRITDWLSPEFFRTEFWFMWATTFAFQPWHSAVEFKRYLHRFMMEFPRIETLGGVKRTALNQYDSMVLPLQRWLSQQNVRFLTGCNVTDICHKTEDGKFVATAIDYLYQGRSLRVDLREEDFVILQNGSMTDASSVGSKHNAPTRLGKAESVGWALWEKLAAGNPGFGNPAAFNSSVAESAWESFTVTLRDPAFIDKLIAFSGNQPGTGGLVTFRDSNWLMSIVIPFQPYFANQPAEVQVFWGYALFPDRIGNYVAKPMAECSGDEILEELCGHLRFDRNLVDDAICIPCFLPYITSMFMPRLKSDRPLPVPANSRNLAFVSQFVEIPDDVVFTVEYSVRAAQMAVYQLLGIRKEIPPILRHDKSLQTQLDVLVKAMR